MTNTSHTLNWIIAAAVGAFYFSFFTYAFIYTHKNKKNLYTKELNEPEEEIPLKEKLKNNPTFKFRNIWHFILKVNE